MSVNKPPIIIPRNFLKEMLELEKKLLQQPFFLLEFNGKAVKEDKDIKQLNDAYTAFSEQQYYSLEGFTPTPTSVFNDYDDASKVLTDFANTIKGVGVSSSENIRINLNADNLKGKIEAQLQGFSTTYTELVDAFNEDQTIKAKACPFNMPTLTQMQKSPDFEEAAARVLTVLQERCVACEIEASSPGKRPRMHL